MAASGGKQIVIYDNYRKPSIMTRIPKFNIEDIDPSLGSGVHPAFSVNGVIKNEIYIGSFLAVLDGGIAYSLPGQSPAKSINYDNASAACVNKGPGWHLMTNWEWAAIVLWCLKNDFQPRGNTSSGKSHAAAWETGTPAPDNEAKTLSGSGPASWRHDGTFAGIADLVGDVWEWQGGLKIVDGKVYMPADNDFNLADTKWPSPTGSQVVFPAGSSTEAGWRSMNTALGSLADGIKKQLVQAMVVPNIISGNTPLSIFSQVKGGFWITATEERLPLRGGSWSRGAAAGLAALYLDNARSSVNSGVGFRPAFIA
jgi:hypothetical protein